MKTHDEGGHRSRTGNIGTICLFFMRESSYMRATTSLHWVIGWSLLYRANDRLPATRIFVPNEC